MSLRVNTNIEAFDAHRNLQSTQMQLSKSMQKLSSGLRINSAADDAAGLAISEKMRSQINGTDQAQRNTMDGISLVQTADGAYNEMHSILQRVRELAVQAQNGTLSSSDTAAIDNEVGQLTAELTRIATNTNSTACRRSPARSRCRSARTPAPATRSRSASRRSASRASAARPRPVPSRQSTSPSRASRAPAPPSVPSRTGSRTPSTTSASTRRTSPPPSRASATSTSPRRRSTSPSSRSSRQSGTAMLAQANSAPNNVLSLLRG